MPLVCLKFSLNTSPQSRRLETTHYTALLNSKVVSDLIGAVDN